MIVFLFVSSIIILLFHTVVSIAKIRSPLDAAATLLALSLYVFYPIAVLIHFFVLLTK